MTVAGTEPEDSLKPQGHGALTGSQEWAGFRWVGTGRRECQIVGPAPWSPGRAARLGQGLNGWGRRMPRGFLSYLQVGNPLQPRDMPFQVLGLVFQRCFQAEGIPGWLFIKIFHSAVLRFPGLLKAFLFGLSHLEACCQEVNLMSP